MTELSWTRDWLDYYPGSRWDAQPLTLYWIVGIAVFVLLEKTIPLGHWLARVSGVALVVWGIALAIQGP